MKEISAGGIVFKIDGTKVKILMIEDRYQKITIPKGKQEKGETLEETAIREIEEETGIKGRLLQFLAKTYYSYSDPERGEIEKEVSYYLVECTGGSLQVQIEEINQVFWADLEVARELQQRKGYDNNKQIFELAYHYLKHHEK